MSVCSAVCRPSELFDVFITKIQEDMDAVQHQSLSRDKLSLLADRFFTYLQANLEVFNGSDSNLNDLVDRTCAQRRM